MAIDYDERAAKKAIEDDLKERQRKDDERHRKEEIEHEKAFEKFRQEEYAKHKPLLDELESCNDKTIQQLTNAFYHSEGWGYGAWTRQSTNHPNHIIDEAPRRIAEYKAMEEQVKDNGISKEQIDNYYLLRTLIYKANEIANKRRK